MASRPLSSAERSILKAYTTSSLRLEIVKGILFGGMFLSAIVFAVAFNLWKWLGPGLGFPDAEQHSLPVLGLTVVACGSWIVWEMLKTRGPTGKDDPAQLDLQAGVAVTEEYNVTAAAEIAELEDEGAGFLLELDDGRVLCVIGQDLYDYAHDAVPEDGAPVPQAVFPSTRISYAYAPRSGIRLHLQGIGEKLATRRLVEMKKSFYRESKGGVRSYTGPLDATFYPGTLDEVLKKFGW